MHAFADIKRAFDPDDIMNPGKIVDPYPMTENLRYGPGYTTCEPSDTVFDYGPWGTMAGMVEMCNGLGQCRKTLVGTMCPSYVATLEELHTTRARANALRLFPSMAKRAAISEAASTARGAPMYVTTDR